MPLWNEFDVVKHVEMRDGCVYKTKVVATIWLVSDTTRGIEGEALVAREHNGDRLQPTGAYHIGSTGPRSVEELNQAWRRKSK
jgi:hypothetical protein